LSTNHLDSLVDGLSRGDVIAVARLISWAENRDPRIGEVLRRVYPDTGKAYRLGITGPPGGGKSTLLARMAVELSGRGEKVAVVAVDPSSPFSGGALLGDRYRMTELSEDPQIFMRSMASRGSLGGLAAATEEAMDLLDAAGFTYLVVETVGVGQVELDIAKATDTVVVVLVPESGDGIQAMKAGLMEIGDVFVVNKSDRDGANRLAGELESMLTLRPERDRWRPEVLKTIGHRGEGVTELLEAAARHRRHLEESDALSERRRRTLKLRLIGEARQALWDRLEEDDSEGLGDLLDRLARRELTPHDAAKSMVDRLSGRSTGSANGNPSQET
jgi:LAO/AO transport system kinase